MNSLRFLRMLPLVLAAASVTALADPPANKHWKLVFSDEFDGDRLDESKWSRAQHGEAFCWNGAKGPRCEDQADVDGQGHFVIKVTRDADGKWPNATPFQFGGLEFAPASSGESPNDKIVKKP